MKLHITLVGGQPAPVYHGIVATQPDKIVFIYSDESRETAERISKVVKITSERRKMDPVDLNDIEKKVTQCAKDFKDDEVSVNISSGTKPWAFFFAKIFGTMPNATLFYVDQNNTLWNLTDKTSRKLESDMDAQFRLMGNEMVSFARFEDYTDEDKRTLTAIVELFQFNPSNMYRLVSEAKTKTHLTEHVIKNGSFIKWDKTLKQFDVGLVKGGKEMRKALKSEHVREMLLKASWFEYQVASMLRKWDRSGAIRLNCIFPYQDSAAKNEIDILVETREKLLFVECKTQIEDNTDIDKFASAVRNYGGMGSKALFVTDRKMSGKAIEKCKDNGILTFSLQDEHLGMPNEKALAMLLDSELFNINTK